MFEFDKESQAELFRMWKTEDQNNRKTFLEGLKGSRFFRTLLRGM